MADLQTVDNIEYEHCKVCDKKVVGGKTHFKIHRTTLQHLKKEEALAAQGLIPCPSPLPEWTDLTQYLKYLDIDEPIIGLSVLEQVEDSTSDKGKVLLNYKCRLCGVETDLYCTVLHVLGRKHRRWYLEQTRPILAAGIRWNSQKDIQPLKAIAAEVEAEEGWGEPVRLFRSNKAKAKRNRDKKSQPSTHRKVFIEQEGPRWDEDLHRRSCETDDTHGRPLSHHDLYDEPYRGSKNQWWSKPTDDKYYAPYAEDDRHRRSHDDFRKAHYEDEDTNMGRHSYSGSDRGCYPNEAYPDVRVDRYFSEIKSSRKKHDFNHDSIDQNRYGEFGSARRPVAQDAVYGSSQRKRPSMDEIEMQGQSFQYSKEEREHYPARERPESRGYRQGHRYFPDENIPAKKPRTDMCSDDSPLETNLGYDRSRERMVSTDTASGKNVDWGVTRFTPKMENVLDVLNNIQIENVQEANFLRERLCTLIKDVQTNKALQNQKNQVLQSSSSFTDCTSMSTSYMDHIKVLAAARSSSNQGFQQSERYDSRRFDGNFGGLQEKQQKSLMFKSDFQDLRKHDDNAASFQQTRGFKDSARDYFHARHYIEGSDISKHTQAYSEDPMRINGGSEKSRYENYGQMLNLRSPYQTNNKKQYGEFHRDVCRTGTAEQPKHQPADDKRTYQEHRRQCYQHEYASAGNLSNTFESSSQVGHSSSLNNLASTLLQLVARKKN